MKRVFQLALLILLVGSASAAAYTSPGNPSGYVNDFAGVLDADTRATLEEQLVTFNASTTNEIAIAIVPSLGDEYIESYAVRLFEEWKIGTAKNNNGVLLLLAIEDRQVRIEVGYGLEGALPDSVANSIIADMIPHLRDNDYSGALQEALTSIMDATSGEYDAESRPFSAFDVEQLMPLIIFGLLALQWLLAILARTKSWWLGGVLGLGVGSIAASIFGLWVVTGLLITIGLTIFGLFFDYVVSSAYRESVKQGTTTPWWAGGPSSGSGGRGGGGFRGFGGGRSGGGGASGRW